MISMVLDHWKENLNDTPTVKLFFSKLNLNSSQGSYLYYRPISDFISWFLRGKRTDQIAILVNFSRPLLLKLQKLRRYLMLPKNIVTNCALGHHLPTDKKLASNKKAVLRNKRSKSGPLVQNGPVRHPTPRSLPDFQNF